MSLKFQTESDDVETASVVAPTKNPTPYYTYILLACIIAVAIAQFATNLNESIVIAGFAKRDFVKNHEYWRILTGGALHGSIPHILFNGYALFSFGKLFETISNRAHLAIVFLLAIIGGGILSLIFLPNGTSVGASGGIVGLIGYLAVYGFRRRKILSSGFLKNILTNIAIIAIYGILLNQTIDNFGHLGGLLAGAIYGLIQVPGDLYKSPLEAGSLTEGVGLFALGTFIAVSIFSILLILRIF